MAHTRAIRNRKHILLKRSLFTHLPLFIITRIVMHTAIRMIYPFLPVFSRGLGVEVDQLSRALSLRSASGVLGPILASIGDNRGRKTGMLVGLGIYSLGLGLVAIWPTYPAFIAMLVLSLAGNLVFIPSMMAYLSDRIPYRRRGLVLALTEISWSLSFIIGVLLVGLLIARMDWRAPFPILAGLGLFFFVLLAVLLPKDPITGDKTNSLRKNLLGVFSSTPARMGLVIGVMISASNEFINVIFGTWMEETFGVKITTLAIATVVIGFSELGGVGLASSLTDFLGKSRSIRLGLLANGLAALAMPFLGQNVTGAFAGLFMIYLTFEFTLVSSIPLMTEILPKERATMLATYFASMAVGRAIGDLTAPMINNFGASFHTWPRLLSIGLGSAALNLVAWVALRILSSRISKP